MSITRRRSASQVGCVTPPGRVYLRIRFRFNGCCFLMFFFCISFTVKIRTRQCGFEIKKKTFMASLANHLVWSGHRSRYDITTWMSPPILRHRSLKYNSSYNAKMAPAKMDRLMVPTRRAYKTPYKRLTEIRIEERKHISVCNLSILYY